MGKHPAVCLDVMRNDFWVSGVFTWSISLDKASCLKKSPKIKKILLKTNKKYFLIKHILL